MKNNKKIVWIIILIVLFLLVFVYFVLNKNNDLNINDNIDKISIVKNLEKSSPKDLYLKRNNELYNSKNMDNFLRIVKKYDSLKRIEELESDLKGANEERKKVLFSFAQAFLVSSDKFINIEEEIFENKAKVVILGEDFRENVHFIKENNNWKLDEIIYSDLDLE